MPVVPLDKRYTLDNHPPAEWANSVIGAPAVLVFAALTASSMRFRYLQYTGHLKVVSIYDYHYYYHCAGNTQRVREDKQIVLSQ